ncbi:hypothetical protein M440DRAFT_166409 [Trichoderma longibrachiatum ATCC 18648]|uniref:Uncharacterized protein n=1 Tax=Trichoderma longibrachiatum ATCC 18648 TaxID=983965 RepID=A0A2T4BRW7_TRILO|nr:hypothetical protein M440DRAFT_166409 [Trichoderma longibrachiatum ATCC 18648]
MNCGFSLHSPAVASSSAARRAELLGVGLLDLAAVIHMQVHCSLTARRPFNCSASTAQDCITNNACARLRRHLK